MNEIFEQFPLIVLAGGQSSRQSAPKGLLPYNGRPWLEEQLRRFSDIGGKKAIVVLGVGAEQYLKTCPWLNSSKTAALHTISVINPHPEKGQFSSLQTGLNAYLQGSKPIPANSGVFILPIDVPVPSQEVWRELINAFSKSTKAIIPEFQGKGGHPALLSHSFAKELSLTSLDSPEGRLDAQIHKLKAPEILRVNVPQNGVLLNLNTPEKWQEFLERSMSTHEPG